MRLPRWIALFVLLVASLACAIPTLSTPPLAHTTTPPPTAPTDTLPAPPPATPSRPEEAILILEPGPGARLISPLRVAGLADPTFEQTLIVRVLSDDGAQITLTPTTIQADLGQRGPFAVDLPFSVAADRNAFIQVFAESARDGGITHLASVGVILAANGPASSLPISPHPETLHITQPLPDQMIAGGNLHVEGFGLASFEQTLVVEVYDADGALVGQEPIMVNAPDLGLPGPFSADVSYAVSTTGPGRVVVRDPSVVHGGDNHLSSVEVTLTP